ncbi:MAG: ATP-binding protein [Streptosporangiaceae bacterium]
MKLRVILLVFAIGSLIVVSFMLPLALLLRTFAADSAVSGGTIRAQFIAPLIATVSAQELRASVQRVNQQNPSERVTIFLPGRRRLGARAPRTSGVALAARGRSFSEPAPGGVAIFVAVQGLRQGTAVIRAFVPDSQLRHGVAHAWLLLSLLAVGLLALAVVVAAQLTKSLVRPLGNVAMAADQLAAGDLTARAPADGPPEIRQVSNGLNRLAARIGELLAHERETLADLSHRLRTPLTALRIDTEALSADQEVMTRVIGDVDVLTRTVNEIIAEARRPGSNGAAAGCDATAVVRARTEYWAALAEDQERWMTVEMPPAALPVGVGAQDLAACVDILLENVFAHTPDGTAFSVRVSPRAAGGAWIVVSDNGPGFSHPDPARRGLSSAGSTGLGLDIARRIAEASDGTLTIGRSPDGGGAVTIGLGPAPLHEPRPRRHIKSRRLTSRRYRESEADHAS